jgi:hypothetical protein
LAFHSGREADHSPPSSAEVKERAELYLHSLNMPPWRGAQLGGAQGQLYLYLSIVNCVAQSMARHNHQPLYEGHMKALSFRGCFLFTGKGFELL